MESHLRRSRWSCSSPSEQPSPNRPNHRGPPVPISGAIINLTTINVPVLQAASADYDLPDEVVNAQDSVMT